MIISFLIGAIYLGFFDWLQVLAGVEIYTTSSKWHHIKVPLQFGILTFLLSFIVPWFEKHFEYKKINTSLKETIFELIFFGIMYLCTLVVWVPSFIIVAMFVYLILIKLFFEYKAGDVYYFLALGFLGPCLESTLVHLGGFRYAHADILGVPYWLPLLWGNGGLVVRRLFNLKILKEDV
jgi:hypothetical protein